MSIETRKPRRREAVPSILAAAGIVLILLAVPEEPLLAWPDRQSLAMVGLLGLFGGWMWNNVNYENLVIDLGTVEIYSGSKDEIPGYTIVLSDAKLKQLARTATISELKEMLEDEQIKAAEGGESQDD